MAYNIIFDSVSIVYCTSILIRFAFHTGYFSGFGTWGVSTNLLSVSRSIDGGPAFSTRENLVPRIPVPRFPPPYMVPRFPSPRFQRPHTDTSALNDDAFLAFLARSSRVLMCLGAILLKHKKSSPDNLQMSGSGLSKQESCCDSMILTPHLSHLIVSNPVLGKNLEHSHLTR